MVTVGRPVAMLARALLLGIAGASGLGAWAALRGARLGSVAAAVSAVVLVVLALLALGAVGSVRWRGRAALAGVSLVLALWIADVALVFVPRVRRLVPTKAAITGDAVSIATLRARGDSVVPAVLPKALLRLGVDGEVRSTLAIGNQELVPLGGVAGVATLARCDEGGDALRYVSDEYGFHNPAGLWRPGEVDLLAVGDSFAHAACVRSGEEAIGRLRARFPRALNLAMSSNGPLLELATIVEYASYLQPKVVLWFYFEGNDLVGDLELEKRNPILSSYLEGGSQQLLARRTAVDERLRGFVAAGLAAANGSHVGPPPSLGWRDLPLGSDRHQLVNVLLLRHLRDRLDLTRGGLGFDFVTLRRALTRGRDVVRGWNGRVYLVYLPAPWRFRGSGAKRSFEDQRRAVLGIADELGLGVIDVTTALAGRDDALDYYVNEGLHFNAKGQLLTAALVEHALERVPP